MQQSELRTCRDACLEMQRFLYTVRIVAGVRGCNSAIFEVLCTKKTRQTQRINPNIDGVSTKHKARKLDGTNDLRETAPYCYDSVICVCACVGVRRMLLYIQAGIYIYSVVLTLVVLFTRSAVNKISF